MGASVFAGAVESLDELTSGFVLVEAVVVELELGEFKAGLAAAIMTEAGAA